MVAAKDMRMDAAAAAVSSELDNISSSEKEQRLALRAFYRQGRSLNPSLSNTWALF